MSGSQPDLHRAVSTGDMKADWDRRARTDFRSAIASSTEGEENFRASGVDDARQVLALLPDKDVGGWRALDYGCGVGRVIEPLSSSFREVTGVDVSGEMVRIGNERMAALKNVRLVTLDSGKLPFETAAFDLAWSMQVFQHMPRAAFHAAMGELSRVVRPGGVFVFHLTYPYSLRRKLRAVLRHDQSPQETYRRRFYTPGELHAVFERCGLQLLRFERKGNKGQHAWYVTRRVDARG